MISIKLSLSAQVKMERMLCFQFDRDYESMYSQLNQETIFLFLQMKDRIRNNHQFIACIYNIIYPPRSMNLGQCIFIIIACFTFIPTPTASYQLFSTPPLQSIPKNNYPVRLGYIDRLFDYSTVDKLASSLGVPGYSEEKIYNYLSLGFWRCADLPSEAALVWSKPVDYFGDDSIFGKTKLEIQQALKKKYTDGKVTLLVSAFGPQEKPSSSGYSAQDCANGLASFVLDNQFDGCDVNWQDTGSFQNNGGDKWLISFHNHLRKLLPNHTIIHSPYAGYFSPSNYPFGNYLGVNTEINKTVNFYSIQYFNQGTSKYSNYTEIFLQSGGLFTRTSVSQLVRAGVDQKKIVVGKPVTPTDSGGSGYIDSAVVGEAVSRAYSEFAWFAGVALLQYSSDVRGRTMTAVGGHLKELCSINKDCK